MKKIVVIFSRYRLIFTLLIVYFLFRLPYLNLLPIFNDEAIYLDWGWAEINLPGHLFESLTDGRQPLLMWVFALFAQIFSDPLLGARLVSVIAGSITLVGLYTLAHKISDKNTAILSCILYIITPLFAFYDRLALMESSLCAIGIWSLNALLTLIAKPRIKHAVIAGIILGIGYFIKSTTLIFLCAFFALYFSQEFRNKLFIKLSGIVILSFLAFNFLLLIQPLFWQNFSVISNSILSLQDASQFPVTHWLNNGINFVHIGFIYITPLNFVFGITGLMLLFKKGGTKEKLYVYFFLICSGLEIFLAKSQNQRYIVAFLPLLLISSAYLLVRIINFNKTFGMSLVCITSIIPILLTITIITNPYTYIEKLSHISRFSETEYIFGHTSGYGINQTVTYLNQESQNKPITVWIGLNLGNPENGVDVYLHKNKNVSVFHMDGRIIPEVEKYDCLSSKKKVYFISRDNNLSGLDTFLEKVTSIKKPYSENTIDIYTLRKNCQGNTFPINLRSSN